MDDWQKAHITANLRQLVKMTLVTEQLLIVLRSANILDEEDTEIIRCSNTRFERARLLFDIVQTRVNGYHALISALADCKQTGASILLQGFLEHVIPPIYIELEGHHKPLSEYFDPDEISEIIGKIRADITPQQYLNFQNTINESSNSINLTNDTIPSEDLFYIPRSLSKKTKINPELFQTSCLDVFVFQKMDEEELLQSVHPNIITFSTAYLREISHNINAQRYNIIIAEQQQVNITSRDNSAARQLGKAEHTGSRFIILDTAEDWKKIRASTKAATHLISAVMGTTSTFILESTTGGSQVLHQYLDYEDGDDRRSISEEQMVETIFQDSTGTGICICDSPGMGKTRLLTKLARTVKIQHPNRIVALFNLDDFTEIVVEKQKQDEKITIPEILIKRLSASPVGHVILERLLAKKAVNLELFFDAFDEVPYQYTNLAKLILIEISKMPKARVCVTSRKHVQHELESCLGVLSYDILPFSSINKIDFFVQFWKNDNAESEKRKLIEFANFCLLKLERNLGKKENAMTGIPLRCLIIATAYAEDAKIYSNPNRHVEPQEICTFERSLPDLFRIYIELNFEKLKKWLKEESQVLEIKRYHEFLALKTLFPGNALSFLKFPPNREFDKTKILSVGLLKKRTWDSSDFQFVHRTTAEVFVAEFFANVVRKRIVLINTSRKHAFKFLFKNILSTTNTSFAKHETKTEFKFPVVVYFFNSFLNEQLNHSFAPLSQHLIKSFSKCISGNNLYELLIACLRCDYSNIFEIMKNILLHLNKSSRKKYRNILLPKQNIETTTHLLQAAVEYTNRHQVEQLFQLYRESFQFDISRFAINVHSPTLLSIAIKKADYEMVQFCVLNSHDLHRSVYDGIHKTSEDSKEMILSKIRICEFLLSRDSSLFKERYHYHFLHDHIEIIKFVIRKAYGPRTVFNGRTVVHNGADHMSSHYFHELCSFLINDCNAVDLFLPNSNEWTPPLSNILLRQGAITFETIEMILMAIECKFSQNVYTMESHLLFDAVHGRRNANTIIALIRYGVKDTSCINSAGDTFLHIASTYLQQQDYHDLICYLKDTGNDGIFYVSNNKEQLPAHVAFHYIDISDATKAIFSESGVALNKPDFSTFFKSAVNNILNSPIELKVKDPLKTSDTGNTFAHSMSIYYNAQEYHGIVEKLVCTKYGELFKTKNAFGETPLHFAVMHMELLPATLYLLTGRWTIFMQDNTYTNKCLVDLNATTNEGSTILHYAARKERSLTFIKRLVDLGADCSLATNKKVNLVHMYAQSALLDHLEYVTDQGCDPNAIDNEGNTALHYAVSHSELHNSFNIVKFLISKGVDKNLPNNNGQTAFQYKLQNLSYPLKRLLKPDEI